MGMASAVGTMVASDALEGLSSTKAAAVGAAGSMPRKGSVLSGAAGIALESASGLAQLATDVGDAATWGGRKAGAAGRKAGAAAGGIAQVTSGDVARMAGSAATLASSAATAAGSAASAVGGMVAADAFGAVEGIGGEKVASSI